MEKCQQRKENLLFKKEIANLEDKLDALQKQLKDNKLPDTANTHASSTINDKMVVSKSTQANFAYTDSIDSKLEKFTTDILDTATKIVDEKLNLLGNHVQTLVKIPEEINLNCKTFKDALTINIPSTSTVTDLKVVLNQNRNDQLVQEAERKRRAQNLIIPGSEKS